MKMQANDQGMSREDEVVELRVREMRNCREK